jgi:hypothetical protein
MLLGYVLICTSVREIKTTATVPPGELSSDGGGDEGRGERPVFQRSQASVQSAVRLSASAVRVGPSAALCRVSAASTHGGDTSAINR